MSRHEPTSLPGGCQCTNVYSSGMVDLGGDEAVPIGVDLPVMLSYTGCHLGDRLAILVTKTRCICNNRTLCSASVDLVCQ
jgi:hypothetical protein